MTVMEWTGIEYEVIQVFTNWYQLFGEYNLILNNSLVHNCILSAKTPNINTSFNYKSQKQTYNKCGIFFDTSM